MRKWLKYTLLVVMAVAVATLGVSAQSSAEVTQQQQQSGPRMTFEVMSYDFGEFSKGGQSKQFDFEFTNTGDAPLVIVRSKSSCRCIEVALPKRPIAPGAKGVVTITYVPKDSGVFHKGVEIFANIPGGSLTLFVKGNVQ